MSISLYFDLRKIKLTSFHYSTIPSNTKDKILLQISSNPENLLVITDSDEGLKYWQKENLPVIAWSHSKNDKESLMSAKWLILSLEALTPDYLQEVYQRFHDLPLTITQTERCLIRELTLEDLDDILSLDQRQSPDSSGRFFPEEFCLDREKALADIPYEKAKDYLENYIHHQYPFYSFGIYGIYDKNNLTFLGIAGFSPSEEEMTLELGYAIREEYRQQGYAKEAILALKKYARQFLEIERIVSRIQEDNIPSIRTATSCGIEIKTLYKKY